MLVSSNWKNQPSYLTETAIRKDRKSIYWNHPRNRNQLSIFQYTLQLPLCERSKDNVYPRQKKRHFLPAEHVFDNILFPAFCRYLFAGLAKLRAPNKTANIKFFYSYIFIMGLQWALKPIVFLLILPRIGGISVSRILLIATFPAI